MTIDLSKLEQIRKESEKLKKEYSLKQQEIFKELWKDFFNLYPSIDTVSWTQYTPYWNDGETCEFTVHTWNITLNGDEESGDSKIEKVASSIIQSIDEDCMKDMFGDHCTVIVSRDGYSVEEYEHE
jgi:hypothetical protein